MQKFQRDLIRLSRRQRVVGATHPVERITSVSSNSFPRRLLQQVSPEEKKAVHCREGDTEIVIRVKNSCTLSTKAGKLGTQNPGDSSAVSPSRSSTRDADHTRFSWGDSWPGRRSGVAVITHVFTDDEKRATVRGRRARDQVCGSTAEHFATGTWNVACITPRRSHQDGFFTQTLSRPAPASFALPLQVQHYRVSTGLSASVKYFVIYSMYHTNQAVRTPLPARGDEEPLVTALLESPPCKAGISA